MKIFAGTACQKLAAKIIKNMADRPGGLSLQIGKIELSRYPNGENKVWIKDDCKNEDVLILQNFSQPVDQNIMQFCLMVDAVKRLNPKKIIGVIPWLGYAKQNKVFRKGESLAAEVVARIVSSSGVDEIILFDVHSENVKGFFSVPVKELSARDLFINHAQSVIASEAKQSFFDQKIATSPTAPRNDKQTCVVVSPDAGAVSRNKYVAEKLNLPIFVIDKERDLGTGKIRIRGIYELTNLRINEFNNKNIRKNPRPQSPEAIADGGQALEIGENQSVHGKDKDISRISVDKQLAGRNVLMFDDMILSGGTVTKDVEYVKSLGAKDVYFFATHLNVSEARKSQPQLFFRIKLCS